MIFENVQMLQDKTELTIFCSICLVIDTITKEYVQTATVQIEVLQKVLLIRQIT